MGSAHGLIIKLGSSVKNEKERCVNSHCFKVLEKAVLGQMSMNLDLANLAPNRCGNDVDHPGREFSFDHI
ncbi:unnamed protein product [Toxocara canis]|uniref:Ovule protein n=1 Tax=Toxocara canis TaxID=6265 RepID=A0A183V9X3_TOXCA|nr:unnamed protein product [Toxocara canis]